MSLLMGVNNTEEGEKGSARLVFNFMTDEDLEGVLNAVIFG